MTTIEAHIHDDKDEKADRDVVSVVEGDSAGSASSKNARTGHPRVPSQAFCKLCGQLARPGSGIVDEFGDGGRRHIACPTARVPTEKQLAARQRLVESRRARRA